MLTHCRTRIHKSVYWLLTKTKVIKAFSLDFFFLVRVKYPGAYISYTKNICWISNTYYIPLDDTIPRNIHERQNKEISYYQWVPIIFLFMAFLFKLPNMVWRMLNGTGGLNMDKLVQMSESTQMGKPEDRDRTIQHVARYLDRWLLAHRQYHFNILVRLRQRFSNIFCFWFAKREGRFLTGFYMFTKFMYCINALSQFFLLNAFLAMDYHMYGFDMLTALSREGELTSVSPRFPRVTLCDFEIRQMQNLQRYTVQCVLPINLFNEKIFMFLWFWLVLVLLISIGSYMSWLYYVLFSHNRYRYVKKCLKIGDHIRNKADVKLARKFSDEYLRDDGVFVLRIVCNNSSELVLNDLVSELWNLFRVNPNNQGARVPLQGSRRPSLAGSITPNGRAMTIPTLEMTDAELKEELSTALLSPKSD
ncbi:innexin [Plakobranchus ocellatus]|uniref:Innexin n=1 Tax=Plakobranchus ocellatus TaxID=259542 RepID=A0AAV4AL08_9GAST|nr:innexin [Plakobranchus ocellatus]